MRRNVISIVLFSLILAAFIIVKAPGDNNTPGIEESKVIYNEPVNEKYFNSGTDHELSENIFDIESKATNNKAPGFGPIKDEEPSLLNQPPDANAGPDQQGYVGENIQFNGSGSYDPDGDFIFSTNIKINDDGLTNIGQFYPSIAVDSEDTIHVVWGDVRNQGTYWTDIYYSKSTDGGQSFLPNVRVNNDTTDKAQVAPVITTNENLDVLVAWADRRDYVDPVRVNGAYFAKSLDKGQSFEPSVKVNDVPGAVGVTVSPIAISCYENDNIFLAWQDVRNFDTTGSDIYFANSTDGGLTFGTNVRVSDDILYGAERVVSMDIDSEGNIFTTWTDARNSWHNDIYFSFSEDFGNSFSSDFKINDDVGDNRQEHSSIAVDKDGNIDVVWHDARDNQYGLDVYYARSSDGGLSFEQNRRVNEQQLNSAQGNPDIALNSFSDIYVVWKDWRSGNGEIYFSYSTDGGITFRKNIKVNDITGRNIGEPKIALDSYGTPHIVWWDYRDDNSGDIYYSRGLPILSYDWDFGDGSPHGNGVRPTHVYSNPGVYTVTLTITDQSGATDSDTCVVTVISVGEPPVANAGSDQTVYIGDLVGFDGSKSYDPDNHWEISTLNSVYDYPSHSGKDTSLAIDKNGYAQISYFDSTNGDLNYAKWNGSSWEFETIDSDYGYTGLYSSLALDENDYAHISYHDATNDTLKYARWDGIKWNIEIVDQEGMVGTHTSLALDKMGFPHISYFDVTNRNLKYAKWDGNNWSIETVNGLGFVGRYNSMVLDSNDYPHISYEDYYYNNRNLKYARWTGSKWSIETIDNISKPGGFASYTLCSSIILDNDDNAHISYFSETEKNLNYTRWTGSTWITETVDSIGRTGSDNSILLDSHGYPHIVYHDMTENSLRYAIWTGSSWLKETVDCVYGSWGWVGFLSSFAFDNEGNTHISYRGMGPNSTFLLKYARMVRDPIHFNWDFDESDGLWWETGALPDATNPTPSHVYGDDGLFIATLRVTDNDNLSATDTCNITVLKQFEPPIANAGPDQTVNEGDVVHFNGSSSYDPDGTIDTYEWDFDINDGLWWETGAIQDATGPTPTHIYGDDVIFEVTLRVTDNDNLSATGTCNATVQNVGPTATIESVSMNVEIGLRVAGRKYNNVSMTLYENDTPIGHISIERLPGSPDEQIAWIPLSVDFSESYSATVTYIQEDPANIGANPVWICIKSQNGSIKKIHHNFNVQQSKNRDSDHWNHIEPWEVDLNSHFIGLSFEIISYITDPGSDDEYLTYTYGTQVVNVTYLNNPPNPDSYPSPEINPVDIMDTTTLVYEGPGAVILVVKDDDNVRLGIGGGSESINIG